MYIYIYIIYVIYRHTYIHTYLSKTHKNSVFLESSKTELDRGMQYG